MGLLLAAVYQAHQRHFLGYRLAGWLRLLPLGLALVVWAQGGWMGWLVVGLALALAIHVLFGLVRRAGYIRFVAEPAAPSANDHAPADSHRLSLRASGVFGLMDRETHVVERPAECWRVPIGEHVLMVQERPGKFLYEFLQPENVQEIQPGRLIFGPHPRLALAVRFLSTWGPEAAGYQHGHYVRNTDHLPKKAKTIYLTFETEQERQMVWRNLKRET
ncbi:MAG: hypothetical protein AB1791_03245 [Chloroflexota bacterium]